VEKAAQQLNSLGPGSCAGFEADISIEANCKLLAETVSKATGGKLDVLINNAGGTPIPPSTPTNLTPVMFKLPGELHLTSIQTKLGTNFGP